MQGFPPRFSWTAFRFLLFSLFPESQCNCEPLLQIEHLNVALVSDEVSDDDNLFTPPTMNHFLYIDRWNLQWKNCFGQGGLSMIDQLMIVFGPTACSSLASRFHCSHASQIVLRLHKLDELPLFRNCSPLHPTETTVYLNGINSTVFWLIINKLILFQKSFQIAGTNLERL